MSELERNIYECLRWFGPCTASTIQVKLDLRGIRTDMMTILNTADLMIKNELIKPADGFRVRAYKL